VYSTNHIKKKHNQLMKQHPHESKTSLKKQNQLMKQQEYESKT
jgi:hypothetical protein